MEFSFTVRIDASKEKIWSFYLDTNKWFEWENNLENMALNGKFSTGSTGIMKLKEMPEIKFILTKVEPNKEFWNQSNTPFGTLCFGHEIFENKNFVYIKHTVRLESKDINVQKMELLKQIFADVPKSMFALRQKAQSIK
ncbi:polyketide cyclase [Campylobacter sp. CCUG 57310]|uniref:polyketide cyclase n=1 Tax=Campylobacter sp. CCUG 57310 TaxID=2517362 RepID=UPI0015652668|nr:polyketide cyclase [Campylobacter sp. CCUG 57310]QKF92623.1 polyketide cyclase [Campylobacter sp. CCUG 57310]